VFFIFVLSASVVVAVETRYCYAILNQKLAGKQANIRASWQ
jgi:hypothetical protein